MRYYPSSTHRFDGKSYDDYYWTLGECQSKEEWIKALDEYFADSSGVGVADMISFLCGEKAGAPYLYVYSDDAIARLGYTPSIKQRGRGYIISGEDLLDKFNAISKANTNGDYFANPKKDDKPKRGRPPGSKNKKTIEAERKVEIDKMKKAQVLHDMMEDNGEYAKYYGRILELAEQYCPHATRILAGLSVDIIWDLPSGNHPGLFLSPYVGETETTYAGGVTAYDYLDFPENTEDGEMPKGMGELDTEMYDRSNSGNGVGGITESDLIDYMKRMDEMCAKLQEVQKSKTSKAIVSDTDWNDFDGEHFASGEFAFTDWGTPSQTVGEMMRFNDGEDLVYVDIIGGGTDLSFEVYTIPDKDWTVEVEQTPISEFKQKYHNATYHSASEMSGMLRQMCEPYERRLNPLYKSKVKKYYEDDLQKVKGFIDELRDMDALSEHCSEVNDKIEECMRALEDLKFSLIKEDRGDFNKSKVEKDGGPINEFATSFIHAKNDIEEGWLRVWPTLDGSKTADDLKTAMNNLNRGFEEVSGSVLEYQNHLIEESFTSKAEKSVSFKGYKGTWTPLAQAGHYTIWKSVEMGDKAYNIVTQTKKNSKTGKLVEKIIMEDVDEFKDEKVQKMFGVKNMEKSYIQKEPRADLLVSLKNAKENLLRIQGTYESSFSDQHVANAIYELEGAIESCITVPPSKVYINGSPVDLVDGRGRYKNRLAYMREFPILEEVEVSIADGELTVYVATRTSGFDQRGNEIFGDKKVEGECTLSKTLDMTWNLLATTAYQQAIVGRDDALRGDTPKNENTNF